MATTTAVPAGGLAAAKPRAIVEPRPSEAGCPFAPRCPEVMDVCRTEVPDEVRYPDGVRVACHLYPPGGEAVPVPTPPVWVPPSARAAAAKEGRA